MHAFEEAKQLEREAPESPKRRALLRWVKVELQAEG